MTVAAPAPVTAPALPEQVSPHARRVLAVTSLGVFIVFLDTTIVNIAFDAISRDFRSSTASLSWVLNAYSLVFAALLVPAGRLADQYGRKRLFLVGLALFAVTSAACGLAPGTAVLVAARGLQAVGAALLVPTSLALLLPEFPAAKRSTAVGTWGAMGAVAAASGPTLGALLVEYAGSWRWVFLVNVPVCALALVLGQRVLREGRDPAATALPAPLGVLLAAASPALASLAVVEGPDWGWTDPRVVVSAVASVVLLGAFLLQSRRTDRPVVDLSLFRVRAYRVANAGTLLFSLAFFANGICNILFLQRVWHYSVLGAALAVTPSPLLAAAVSPRAGRLADRYGHRAVVVPGALLFALGQLWFAGLVGLRPDYTAAWLPGAAMVGLGIGLTLPTMSAAAAASLPPARFAVGSAVNGTARQLGAVLGVSVFVAVIGTPTRATVLHDFHRAWVVIAVVSTAAALTGLGLRTRPRPAGVPVPVVEPAPAVGS